MEKYNFDKSKAIANINKGFCLVDDIEHMALDIENTIASSSKNAIAKDIVTKCKELTTLITGISNIATTILDVRVKRAIERMQHEQTVDECKSLAKQVFGNSMFDDYGEQHLDEFRDEDSNLVNENLLDAHKMDSDTKNNQDKHKSKLSKAKDPQRKHKGKIAAVSKR